MFPAWIKAHMRARYRRSLRDSVKRNRSAAAQKANDATSAPPGLSDSIPRNLLDAPNTFAFSLAPFRNKMGDHWQEYGPGLHRIANRVLSAKMAGRGSIKRYGDTYLITFDGMPAKQARAAGLQLYDEFKELVYRGMSNEDMAEGKKGRKKDNPTSRKRNRGLLRRLYRRISQFFTRRDDDPATPEAAVGESDENGGKTASGKAGRTSVPEPGRQRAPAARRGFTANRTTSGPSQVAGQYAAPRKPQEPKRTREALKVRHEARAIENAMAMEVLRRKHEWSRELADRYFPPPELSFIYRSMWNLKSDHLTTYTSAPICWENSMEILHGEDVVPLPRRPDKLFALDLLNLENTIDVFDTIEENESKVLFMTSVHAPTLVDETMRREYLATAEKISPAARQNLIFEILDIAEYAFQVEATKMVKRLAPYARAVTVSVGLDDRNFAFWKQCGIMAVGVDLSRDARPEKVIVGKFRNFAAQARRNHLQSYLRELDRRSQAIYAENAGFDFLEGALIGSANDPNNLELAEFSLEDLYKPEQELVWAS